MSDRPQKIQIPNQLLQQMLGGQRAERPPNVVEVLCGNGNRSCFNMDDVERIDEDNTQDDHCLIKLRGEEGQLSVQMTYDDFLLKANVQPKQLYIAETDTGN